MSNLPSIEEFEQVLKNILSSSNNIRNQAEENYNKAKTNPDYCVASLVTILRNSKDVGVNFILI
jgi:flagellar hook-basal body complex protein FliE